MGAETPQRYLTKAVVALLAQRGILTHREGLAEMSDALGIGVRAPLPPGRGPRRWTEEEIEMLAAAFELHRRGFDPADLRRLIAGEADPHALAAPIIERLHTLAQRSTAAA